MPARRELTMRQIKQMLRLAHDGVSAREIGRTLGIARSTVQDNLGRATAAARLSITDTSAGSDVPGVPAGCQGGPAPVGVHH